MLLADIEYLVNNLRSSLCLYELIYRWDEDIKGPNEWLRHSLFRRTQRYLGLAQRMLPDGTFETREQAKTRANEEFFEVGVFSDLSDENWAKYRREYYIDGRKRVALDDYDYWDALRTETERLFEETKWGNTDD